MTPDEVRAIRLEMNLSQAAFAARFGLNLSTLREWEQGIRPPGLYARRLLKVIRTNPDAVASTITG